MPVKPWKRAQVLGTREHLIETATRLFGRQGYAATPLEQVVGEAGLTRGAVYHHFKDKQALFAAVIDRVLRDRVFAVEKAALKRAAQTGVEDPADTLWLFVQELRDPAARRIVALDGPPVLGVERWRELLATWLLGPIERVLAPAVAAGRIDAELVPGLARVLFGAVQQAALDAEEAEPSTSERALRLLADRLLGAPRAP